MKPIRVSFICRTSLIVRTLIQSLLVTPLIAIALIFQIHQQQTRAENLLISTASLQNEIRFLKQSISAAKPPSSSDAKAMSTDRVQVIQHLSLNVADGLAMLELLPPAQSKLKSISIEGNTISAEYELPSLQSASMMSETLNSDGVASQWTLAEINKIETSTFGIGGIKSTPTFVGRWVALIHTSQPSPH
jgi:hypothetical protein